MSAPRSSRSPRAAALPSRLDRSRLPDPETFYAAELGALQGRGEWRSAVCPLHDDRSPSLRVNTQTGAFRCMACGAHGGDVLAFQQQRHGVDFKAACKALGAWVEG